MIFIKNNISFLKKLFSIVFFVLFFTFYCCSSNKSDSYKNVRFNFTASAYSLGDPKVLRILEIEAELINDNTDTVYFLSTTCEGDQYHLVYDKKKMTLWPGMMCNGSVPVKISIPPKGKYKFRARFKCLQFFDWIDIGFQFYKVNSDLDVKGKSFNSLIQDQKNAPVLWSGKRLVHMREMYR